MCSGHIQLPLHRERTYGKNRRTTVKNLYDLTSTYFEGKAALIPKAKRGYSRVRSQNAVMLH